MISGRFSARKGVTFHEIFKGLNSVATFLYKKYIYFPIQKCSYFENSKGEIIILFIDTRITKGMDSYRQAIGHMEVRPDR